MKVVYKPLKRFREESGLISKNVTYTYQQVTEITNTRSEMAIVTFTDQVPRSEDEKLKVRREGRDTCCSNSLTFLTLLCPSLLSPSLPCLPPSLPCLLPSCPSSGELGGTSHSQAQARSSAHQPTPQL